MIKTQQSLYFHKKKIKSSGCSDTCENTYCSWELLAPHHSSGQGESCKKESVVRRASHSSSPHTGPLQSRCQPLRPGFRTKHRGPGAGGSSWLDCRQGCVQITHRLGWGCVTASPSLCAPSERLLIWRSDTAAGCEGRSYKPFENVLASLTSLKNLQARASLSKFLWWMQIQ